MNPSLSPNYERHEQIFSNTSENLILRNVTMSRCEQTLGIIFRSRIQPRCLLLALFIFRIQTQKGKETLALRISSQSVKLPQGHQLGQSLLKSAVQPCRKSGCRYGGSEENRDFP